MTVARARLARADLSRFEELARAHGKLKVRCQSDHVVTLGELEHVTPVPAQPGGALKIMLLMLMVQAKERASGLVLAVKVV